MARGGPRLGSGHATLADSDECARDQVIRIAVTKTEKEIVVQLAAQWQVPMGTAAYGMLMDRINECRKGISDAGSGIVDVVAASRIIVKAADKRARAIASGH